MKKRDIKRVIDALIEWSDEISYTYMIGNASSEVPELLFSEKQILDWLRSLKKDERFFEALTEDAK